ncbi:MAG: GreA/GreB family elongation factor [Kiritimatiellae bacterium]|nr:GreA/GreB family elongation factor [Kiritimatiellia bacterium]MDD4734635.1 GreA/GreB family elongation factor [Kiritimatiellia bacterium]
MTAQHIVLTSEDKDKLLALVELAAHPKNALDRAAFKKLAGEIERATVVELDALPKKVVTMNTVVDVEDMDGGEVLRLTLSWPEEADPAKGHVNVLAPLGVALLGTHAGDEIEWAVPAGMRRYRIAKIIYQPEAASNKKARAKK